MTLDIQGTLVMVLLFTSLNFAIAQTNCSGGFANGYPCDQINLQAQLDLSQLGSTGDGNDIWGWTDPMTQKEYALVGLFNGTAFVDISDPVNPIRLGNLPTRSSNSLWRDIKVIGDYAYIVSEASGHGMQVFDLTRLRNVANPPVTFTSDAVLDFGTSRDAHNIVANEEAGFVYLVGTSNYGSGGITSVDVSNPFNPLVVSNYGSDGYTHDAICVQYRGPDQEHIGKELCIGLNGNELVILNMDDKDNIIKIAAGSYSEFNYVHQAWLTDDHRYLLVNDESDESSRGNNTRTHIFDLLDLNTPAYLGFHEHATAAIDHNLYIKGSYAYLANYRAGLRVMDLIDVENGNLTEKAFFDVHPSNDDRGFSGSWSNYPYFKSGNIIINSIEEGLFVVKPSFPHYVFSLHYPTVIELRPGETKSFTVDYNQYAGFSENVNLSIPNLASDLSVNLSQDSISADGQITVTISANLAAIAQNYSLILQGISTSSGVEEKIALGVKVDGDPVSTCQPMLELNGNISSGEYRAANTLISNATIEEGANVLFESGGTITLEDGFQTEDNATFTARIQPCPSSGTPSVPTTPDVILEQTAKRTQSIQIAPNPFRGQSSIWLDLAEAQEVEIQLYDLTGRPVKSVASAQKMTSGRHHFLLEGKELESGFYVLMIRTGEEWRSEKITILR
ncbi:MAG: choice-of-anchor B family protein [Bacteroidota bacterium]